MCKHKKQEDYIIVSELSHHYMEDADDINLTEGQAKALIGVICGIFIAVVLFTIFGINDNAEAIDIGVVSEKTLHSQLIDEADALCQLKIENTICDDVIELDTLLERYNFIEVNGAWQNDYGKLTMDFAGKSPLTLYYQPVKFGGSEPLVYECSAGNDYYCKLGRDLVSLSDSDMKAFGRMAVGIVDDFK